LALIWEWVGRFLARQEKKLKRSRAEVNLPPSKVVNQSREVLI
jgi:hypothetical protein